MPSKTLDRAVAKFLAGISDESRRADCVTLIDLMRKATKHEPRMWGSMVGFASRKPDLTLYLGACFAAETSELDTLGRHKRGKGCLYIRRLEDIDLAALGRLLATAVTRNKTWAAERKADG